MKKCGKCCNFRIVKIIYNSKGQVEDNFGYYCKNGYENDELISAFEPSCRDFLKTKENYLSINY